jgi:hypothetical protein
MKLKHERRKVQEDAPVEIAGGSLVDKASEAGRRYVHELTLEEVWTLRQCGNSGSGGHSHHGVLIHQLLASSQR